MEDYQIRIKCIELALFRNENINQVLNDAEQMFAFIKGQKEKTND